MFLIYSIKTQLKKKDQTERKNKGNLSQIHMQIKFSLVSVFIIDFVLSTFSFGILVFYIKLYSVYILVLEFKKKRESHRKIKEKRESCWMVIFQQQKSHF